MSGGSVPAAKGVEAIAIGRTSKDNDNFERLGDGGEQGAKEGDDLAVALDDRKEELEKILFTKPDRRQICVRISMVFAWVAVICGIIAVSVYYRFLDPYQKTGYSINITPTTSSLTFNLDGCTLNMQSAGDDTSTIYFTITTTKFPTYAQVATSVSITNDDDLVLSVVDTRPLGNRYKSYMCLIQAYVAPGTILPPTTFNVLGYQMSSISSTSVQWGTSDVTFALQYPRDTAVKTYFRDFSCGKLYLSFEIGNAFFLDATILGATIRVNQPQANAYLRLTHSASIDLGPPTLPTGVANTSVCLTGDFNAVVNRTVNISYTGDPNSPRLISTRGPGFVHIMASYLGGSNPPFPISAESLDDYLLTNATTYPAAQSYSINKLDPVLNADDLAAISTAVSQFDYTTIYVEGPGAPNVRWLYSKTLFYLIVSTSFLDVFTWRILTPTHTTLNATLAPAFCPGLQWSGRQEWDFGTSVITWRILSKQIGAPYAAFRTVDTSTFLVQKGAISGQFAVYELLLRQQPFTLALIILSFILSTFAGAYVVYALSFRLAEWGRDHFEEWGQAYWGEKFPKKKAALMEKIDYFFWLEFLVGYPGSRESVGRTAAIVVVHLFGIWLPGLPTTIALLLFYSSTYNVPIGRLDPLPVMNIGKNPMNNFCFFLVLLLSLMGCMGVIALLIYYLDPLLTTGTRKPTTTAHAHLRVIDDDDEIGGGVSGAAGRSGSVGDRHQRQQQSSSRCCEVSWYYLLNRPLRIFRRVTLVLIAIVSFISLFYLFNVMFWMLLGVMVKPAAVLPIAAVVVVLAVHLYGTFDRLRSLARELQEDTKDRVPIVALTEREKEVKAEKLEEIKVTDVNKLNTAELVQIVAKSKILEISGLSLYERLLKELIVFITMSSLLGFLAVGFYVLSSSNNFVSALTTVMVFIVGGGVNIPLAGSKDSEDNKKRWLARIKSQAKEDQEVAKRRFSNADVDINATRVQIAQASMRQRKKDASSSSSTTTTTTTTTSVAASSSSSSASSSAAAAAASSDSGSGSGSGHVGTAAAVVPTTDGGEGKKEV